MRRLAADSERKSCLLFLKTVSVRLCVCVPVRASVRLSARPSSMPLCLMSPVCFECVYVCWYVFACVSPPLQEKGTVYNEMLASFQQADFCGFHELNRRAHDASSEGLRPGTVAVHCAPPILAHLTTARRRFIYGRGHPLGFEAGGTPQGIRTSSPERMRAFHGSRYRLDKMGASCGRRVGASKDAEG